MYHHVKILFWLNFELKPSPKIYRRYFSDNEKPDFYHILNQNVVLKSVLIITHRKENSNQLPFLYPLVLTTKEHTLTDT